MTHTRLSDDDRLGRAWTAFARHDAAVLVPDRLDQRVRESVAARLTVGVPRGARVSRSGPLMVAAATIAVCLTAGIVLWRFAAVEPVTAPSPVVPGDGEAAAVAPVPQAVVSAPTDAADNSGPRRRRAARARAAVEVPGAPTVAPRAADPAVAGDVMQVIRVRIDVGALDAFGVQVVGLESAGLVDVDLVVGADGWPRDVRRIRPVSDCGLPE
jgi:hypothetical protein